MFQNCIKPKNQIFITKCYKPFYRKTSIHFISKYRTSFFTLGNLNSLTKYLQVSPFCFHGNFKGILQLCHDKNSSSEHNMATNFIESEHDPVTLQEFEKLIEKIYEKKFKNFGIKF